MIKPMVDGFCAMGDRCDSACGIWEHLHSFKEVKCLQCYFNTFLWVYKNLKVSPVAIGHSLVVIIPDWILWVASFQSLFYVTCIQNQWGHTLAVQVQWQDGILICFLILTVNVVWKTDEGEAESIVLLIFVLWQCFNFCWVRGGGFGQKVLFRASWNCILFQAGF